MQITFSTTTARTVKANVLVVPCFESKEPLKDYGYGKRLAKLLLKGQFTGKTNGAVFVPSNGAVAANAVIFVGLGKKEEFTLSVLRGVIAGAVRSEQASNLKFSTFAVDLSMLLKALDKGEAVAQPGGTGNLKLPLARWLGQAVAEAAQLGVYTYEKLFAADSKHRKHRPSKLLIIADKKALADVKRGAADGQALAATVNWTRDLVNDPANIMRPGNLARAAQEAAKGIANLTCTVLNKAKLQQLKMGALLGVNAGSSDGDGEARLICLEYKGGAKDAAPLCFVGKGLTFDTGGYNLKTGAGGPLGMKMDMGGGAATLGGIIAIAKLALPINVVAVVPTTENMINELATCSGDVHVSMSGLTVEVNNTDAEGRLILCDALTYAQRTYKPDTIVDMATLTGAVSIALGDQIFAVLGNDDGVMKEMADASKNANEPSWPLPLPKEYDSYMDSTIADVSNTGPAGKAGTIMGAMFLKRFIDKGQKWAHLDIAAVAWNDGKIGGVAPAKGATGIPVRSLVAMARERCGA